jgi:hypothetical protein
MLRKLEREQVLTPSFLTVAQLARKLELTLDELAAGALRAGEKARRK